MYKSAHDKKRKAKAQSTIKAQGAGAKRKKSARRRRAYIKFLSAKRTAFHTCAQAQRKASARRKSAVRHNPGIHPRFQNGTYLLGLFHQS